MLPKALASSTWLRYSADMEEKFIEPHHWLEAEYLARRQRNPSYSLRSFARTLDLPSGRVSQLLSRKRNFTPSLGKKIALRLNYDPLKTHQLIASISQARTLPTASEDTYSTLDMDQFQSIADPIHFALLSLVETDDFQSTPKFIAARLGISAVEARAAIERLVRVGLLKNNEGKITLANSPGLTTTHDIQSSALQHAHAKTLEHAAASLEAVAVELRDITSITMAIDPDRLPEAKKKLRSLRRELCAHLEGGKKSEVYRLNIQLVPVTKRGKNQ